MFSSNDLIQLVFANENDIYYDSSLLKPDLDQYLWFKLHKQQYSTVYFLSPENGGSIKTFGDVSRKSFDESADGGFKKLFSGKKNHDALGSWMLRQLNLKQSESAAFVCALSDFCDIFKDPIHKPALSAMASSDKRTGIIVLTLPANVDKSAKLLLESPVFDYLNETAITDVRGGDLRDMFTAIFKAKHERDSCCFVNEFTKGAALGVLTNVVIEDMSDCPSRAELECAAEYLAQYVNNPALHRIDRVLRSCRPDMPRREVYLQLRNDEVRRKLFEKAGAVRRHGGLLAYMKYLACEPVDLNAAALHITRDPDSCAGRCLAHRPPKNADSVAVQGEPASNILSGIRNEAMQPKNRPENEKMAREAKEFLREAETEAEKGDLETYRWAIYSVRLCMQWLYVAPDESEGSEESSILSIIKNLHNLLSLSSNYYTIRRNLSYSEAHMGYGKMSAVTMQQTKSMVHSYEKKLELLQDLVPAKIMKLSTQGISLKEMKDLAQSLSDEIDDVKETIGEHENCSEQIIPPGDDGDENFVLEASDYDFHIW